MSFIKVIALDIVDVISQTYAFDVRIVTNFTCVHLDELWLFHKVVRYKCSTWREVKLGAPESSVPLFPTDRWKPREINSDLLQIYLIAQGF